MKKKIRNRRIFIPKKKKKISKKMKKYPISLKKKKIRIKIRFSAVILKAIIKM